MRRKALVQEQLVGLRGQILYVQAGRLRLRRLLQRLLMLLRRLLLLLMLQERMQSCSATQHSQQCSLSHQMMGDDTQEVLAS